MIFIPFCTWATSSWCEFNIIYYTHQEICMRKLYKELGKSQGKLHWLKDEPE